MEWVPVRVTWNLVEVARVEGIACPLTSREQREGGIEHGVLPHGSATGPGPGHPSTQRLAFGAARSDAPPMLRLAFGAAGSDAPPMLRRFRALVGHRPATSSTSLRIVPLADDDAALKAELGGLPQRTQAAFAASCAERLYPAYAGFLRASGRDDRGLVRRTLDLAWEGAIAGEVGVSDPVAVFDACVATIPVDDAGAALPGHAGDAIACVAYAFQAAAGLDGRAAGFAAEQVTNALDSFLLSNDIDGSDPGSEQAVWEHPLVAMEIAHRRADLRRLADASDWAAAVEEVRTGATGVSALPLDRLDHET